MEYGFQLNSGFGYQPPSFINKPQSGGQQDLYPGLNEAQKKWLEDQARNIPEENRQQEKQKLYEGAIKVVKQREEEAARTAHKNSLLLQAESTTDQVKKNSLTTMYKMGNLADAIKKKAGLPASYDDKEVIEKTMGAIPNGNQLFMDYMQKGDDTVFNIINNSGQPAPEQPKQDGGTIVGNALGGLYKSAAATTELGGKIGDWIGYKVIQGLYGKEEADRVAKKMEGSSATDAVNDLLDRAGVDSNSAEFKILKTLGDTAQVLAPVGSASKGAQLAGEGIPLVGKVLQKGVDIADKGAGIISKISAIPAATKAGQLAVGATKLGVEGALATQKASLISDQELATAGETLAGGALNAVLGGAIEGFKNLPKLSLNSHTKDVLKNTSVDELNNYVDIVKNSKKSITNPTAFEVASNKVDDALSALKQQADDVGSQIGAIRTAKGGTKTYLLPIVDDANAALRKYGNVEIKFSPKGYTLKTLGKINTLPDDEMTMLQNMVSQFNAIKKSTQVGDLIAVNKYLTNNAGKIEKASPQFKAIVANIKNGMNTAINKAVPTEYQSLLGDYAKTQGLLDDIVAKNGQEGLRGESLMRSLFNSNSKGTRDLFTRIKESTGVDLFKESQLAKFVSDVMGDDRGLKMILGDIKSELIKAGGKKLQHAVADPIKGARRMIKGSGKTRSPKGIVGGSATVAKNATD